MTKCAHPKLVAECPRCGVFRNERIAGNALRCGNCHVEWNIPEELKRFRHMQPAVGCGGVRNGCVQAIHDAVILAASEEAATAYVRSVHGGSHWVIPVENGEDYG
jgi:hypothetical protein